MIIAVIGGTGDQGFGLALRWAKAGEHVIIGSRQKTRAEEAAARLKEKLGNANVEGYENPEAASKAEVVVLTVPFAAQIDILKSIRSNMRKGQILVDVTVPLETAVGGSATRLLGVWYGSAAQQAAALMPKDVDVVSAFQNLSAETLQDLSNQIDCDVIVCGNNENAKKIVMDLACKIPNVRPVDGGPLENSRMVEQITALLLALNIKHKVRCAGLRLTGV